MVKKSINVILYIGNHSRNALITLNVVLLNINFSLLISCLSREMVSQTLKQIRYYKEQREFQATSDVKELIPKWTDFLVSYPYLLLIVKLSNKGTNTEETITQCA